MMKLVVILPFDMTARHLLETGSVQALRSNVAIDRVFLVGRHQPVTEPLFVYQPLLRPWKYSSVRPRTVRRIVADTKLVIGYFLHLALVCRFNILHKFRGFSDR